MRGEGVNPAGLKRELERRDRRIAKQDREIAALKHEVQQLKVALDAALRAGKHQAAPFAQGGAEEDSPEAGTKAWAGMQEVNQSGSKTQA